MPSHAKYRRSRDEYDRSQAEYHRRIREGNAEAIGAASVLFAIMIVGGFLFYSLKITDPESFRAASKFATGYGVSPVATDMSASVSR